MDRLEQQFEGQVDFFHLDVDLPETREVRHTYGLTRRSQYALVDAEGNVIQTWIGPLNEAAVLADIEQFLNGT